MSSESPGEQDLEIHGDDSKLQTLIDHLVHLDLSSVAAAHRDEILGGALSGDVVAAIRLRIAAVLSQSATESAESEDVFRSALQLWADFE